MSKFSIAMRRFGGFMKRNAFYFLIVLCIASVATVIALAVTRNDSVPDDNTLNVNPNPDDTPVVKPDDANVTPTPTPTPVIDELKFYMPCNGTVSKNYNDATIAWNPTLKQYSTHTALDFISEDLNVYCSADGIIKEIGYNNLDGNYVEISHEDGYTTRYLSLESPCTLKTGASVKHGQLLGKMSTTQGCESTDGAHLHFEMLKNGELINPLEIMISSEK